MAERIILRLGDERLYQVCRPLGDNEQTYMKQVGNDLRDTLLAFRKQHGFGRAIAAPQINEPVRMIYMNLKDEETFFINPVLVPEGDETFELWDDCMSFPGLEVLVKRWKRCRIDYTDLNGEPQTFTPEGDLSELLQHEYDHLDGILAVQRAIDPRGFRMR